MKVYVIYSVEFETELEVDDVSEIENALAEIEIPEDGHSSYVVDSFNVDSVCDENEQEIDY